MRILVTGHAGFIGQNLVKILRSAGHTVDGWEWSHNQFPDVSKYQWVMHLGAISATTERDVDKVMLQNLEFSQWVFKQCNKHRVNLQYSSSASVYGLLKDFGEEDPVDPRTPYAWSKYLFDRWVQQQPQNIFVQGFRYFNVYGNHEEHKGTQASPVTQFFKQAAEANKIKLFHDSDTMVRDFIAVEDVCRVHIEFMNNISESGVWNVGTGKPISFGDVASLVSKHSNAAISYVEMPSILKHSYQYYTRADLSKLERTLGPQQWISMTDWIAKYKTTL